MPAAGPRRPAGTPIHRREGIPQFVGVVLHQGDQPRLVVHQEDDGIVLVEAAVGVRFGHGLLLARLARGAAGRHAAF